MLSDTAKFWIYLALSAAGIIVGGLGAAGYIDAPLVEGLDRIITGLVGLLVGGGAGFAARNARARVVALREGRRP